jgi:hypothetical protein
MNIKKFNQFSLVMESETISFLKGLKKPEINSDLNDLFRSNDFLERKELIEDILLEIGDIVDDEQYHKIEDELNSEFLQKNN